MRTPLVCMLLSLSAAAAGCTNSDPTEANNQSHVQADLDLNRMYFTRVLRPAYAFTWQQSCECTRDTTRPIRITVTDQAISKAVYVDDQQPVSDSVRTGLKTIDGVFDLIQERLDEHAAEVSVAYDDGFYPSTVFIDVSKQIADEEFSLHISDFTSGTGQ